MVRSREHTSAPANCVTLPVHILCDPYRPVQHIPIDLVTSPKSFGIVIDHSEALPGPLSTL